MAYDLLIRTDASWMARASRHSMPTWRCIKGRLWGVGKSNGAAAKRTIDAAGRVVAPGFMITTPISTRRPCGIPIAARGCTTGPHHGRCRPVRPGSSPRSGRATANGISNSLRRGTDPATGPEGRVDVTWESVGDYLNALGKKRGINVGTLGRPFGHPPLCDGRGRLRATGNPRGNGSDAAVDPRGDA